MYNMLLPKLINGQVRLKHPEFMDKEFRISVSY